MLGHYYLLHVLLEQRSNKKVRTLLHTVANKNVYDGPRVTEKVYLINALYLNILAPHMSHSEKICNFFSISEQIQIRLLDMAEMNAQARRRLTSRSGQRSNFGPII
jgi:hypothetical protein